MSLYYVQKFLYELNRDEAVQARYRADRRGVLVPYELTDEETEALVSPDIGLLFHLGVNGQILMHFAAFHQIEWADYLRLMREGMSWSGREANCVYLNLDGDHFSDVSGISGANFKDEVNLASASIGSALLLHSSTFEGPVTYRDDLFFSAHGREAVMDSLWLSMATNEPHI